MKAYFANFIKKGNPNGEALAEWDAVPASAKTPPVMVINAQSSETEADDRRYPILQRLYEMEE
jgi:para-nitrobenzyl esterase